MVVPGYVVESILKVPSLDHLDWHCNLTETSDLKQLLYWFSYKIRKKKRVNLSFVGLNELMFVKQSDTLEKMNNSVL